MGILRATFAATILVVAALPTMASAQAPSSPATPPPPTAIQGGAREEGGNTACAPSKLSNPNARPGVTTGQSDSAPLSDRLAAGNGVLCPPSGVDPEIRAPTPDAGKMPVIPPPGSPGGDKSVQPK
jgi:hypothetical protein